MSSLNDCVTKQCCSKLAHGTKLKIRKTQSICALNDIALYTKHRKAATGNHLEPEAALIVGHYIGG